PSVGASSDQPASRLLFKAKHSRLPRSWRFALDPDSGQSFRTETLGVKRFEVRIETRQFRRFGARTKASVKGPHRIRARHRSPRHYRPPSQESPRQVPEHRHFEKQPQAAHAPLLPSMRLEYPRGRPPKLSPTAGKRLSPLRTRPGDPRPKGTPRPAPCPQLPQLLQSI